MARSANREAVDFLERALALAGGLPETSETMSEGLDVRIDVGRLIEAHHSLWPTLVAMGEPARALPHMERGIALYDPDQHASFIRLYGGHDPGACCRYHLALAQWLLGNPDRALATAQDAARLADRLGHPMTTAITLWFLAFVQYERGELAAAAQTAARDMAIIEEHGFANSSDAVVLLHAARGDRLSPDALAAIEVRLARTQRTRWRKVVTQRILAGMYADAGRPDEALRVLGTLDERQAGGFYAPEIYRMEGELILQAKSGAIAEAEGCFREGIEDARRRQEKSLELRAVTSLARLWRGQARHQEAQALLAAAYGSFTEGFATADLAAAKALLA